MVSRHVGIMRDKVERLDLVSSAPLSGPLLVHIETTNKCNFSCKFCPESLDDYLEQTGSKKYSMLSLEDFSRIINHDDPRSKATYSDYD